MARLDEYMTAYRGEYKGGFQCVGPLPALEKKKIFLSINAVPHISTEPVCPLTQSQGEQDQVFSLLSNTKQVGINPVSSNKAETGTKVNKYRLLEVYAI